MPDLNQVLTYCIEYLVGDVKKRAYIYAAGPDFVAETEGPESDVIQADMVGGGVLRVPLDLITNVFQTKYKALANWSGQGHETVIIDEDDIAPNADKIKQVKTLKDEVVFRSEPNPLDKKKSGDEDSDQLKLDV